ncbi:MAG: hypothetical protein JXO48_00590 [Deltaproteobacteria bacterium]|nr:hypothetical protein [Deltaproteobacteria bacterium]
MDRRAGQGGRTSWIGRVREMLKRKEFWYVLMFGAVALWIIVIIFGRLLFESPAGRALLPVALLALHCIEVPHALRVAGKRGFPSSRVMINTIIFGFTWWVPVSRGVFNRWG